MSTIQEDLNQFHEFASRLLSQSGSEYSLEELLRLYHASPANADTEPPQDAEIERRFLQLAIEWKATVGLTSSLSEMFLHPAYLQIIGMGQAVVPFLFRELREDVDHWFCALSAILGANPVPPAHAGHLELMAQDWLNWGRAHGWLDA